MFPSLWNSVQELAGAPETFRHYRENDETIIVHYRFDYRFDAEAIKLIPLGHLLFRRPAALRRWFL